ncbi:uncharacterized protein TNCV_2513681 [Trichonephila clavipes]|nr:uncharacterized protein TNCV_2513681 [Trichonephila clavipes]
MAPVQIQHVLEPVQIPLVPHPLVHCPTFTCVDSTCPRSCADSIVTSPTATCADSIVTSPTATSADSACADSRCPRPCAVSIVTSPTATCADSRACTDSTCPRTYADSTCPRTTPVQIPNPVQILHVPEPMQIPEPEQIPPEFDTLEPTDALDQLMSFVFGPRAQEFQLLHMVPSIFDGDFISFLDEFERELEPMDLKISRLNPCVKILSNLKPSNPWICLLVSVQHLLDQCRHRTTIVFGNLGRWPDRVTYYESEYPYTIFFEPNFGVHVPRSFGKTVIVFTSHLDLTWDKGVDLNFFRVGRSPSHQVWEAYQPQNTEAYTLDLTHCTRLADVYVTWLTWLGDWEMHRDENLPWRVACPQPWKRALETHVNARIRTLWPMGCPLTSSSIYKENYPSFSDKAPCNPFILLMPTLPEQASAHQTVHCNDSQRSPSDHGESCRVHLHDPRT